MIVPTLYSHVELFLWFWTRLLIDCERESKGLCKRATK